MENKCGSCNRTFSSKYNLATHIKTQICTKIKKSIINKTCYNCNKILSSNRALNYHMARVCNSDKTIIDKRNDILEKEIEDMKNEISKLKSSMVINGNNNIINNTNNTVNINITPYNQPNNYIDTENIKKILNKGFKSVQELITHIHFNKDHPENHNIFISNKKDWLITYYDGTEWKISEKDDILNDLYDNNCMFLIDKYDELMPLLDNGTLFKFGRFKDESDAKKTTEDIKKDIKFILYNKRDLVSKKVNT